MGRKVHSYESGELTINYDVGRCIHAEACIHGLPSVFDPERRPWIHPGAADADDVIEVVERCPTGALTYSWKGDGRAEEPAVPALVRISEDGPLYLRGKVTITLPDGEALEAARVALCRCGRSRDKPFCDNSHLEAGFSDPALIEGLPPALREEARADSLALTPVRNGPVLVQGSFTLEASDGTRMDCNGGALCRCGHSATKPFCDGSHRRVEFSTEPEQP